MADSDEATLDLVLGGLNGLSAGVLVGNGIGELWWAQADSSFNQNLFCIILYITIRSRYSYNQ